MGLREQAVLLIDEVLASSLEGQQQELKVLFCCCLALIDERAASDRRMEEQRRASVAAQAERTKAAIKAAERVEAAAMKAQHKAARTYRKLEEKRQIEEKKAEERAEKYANLAASSKLARQVSSRAYSPRYEVTVGSGERCSPDEPTAFKPSRARHQLRESAAIRLGEMRSAISSSGQVSHRPSAASIICSHRLERAQHRLCSVQSPSEPCKGQRPSKQGGGDVYSQWVGFDNGIGPTAARALAADRMQLQADMARARQGWEEDIADARQQARMAYAMGISDLIEQCKCLDTAQSAALEDVGQRHGVEQLDAMLMGELSKRDVLARLKSELRALIGKEKLSQAVLCIRAGHAGRIVHTPHSARGVQSLTDDTANGNALARSLS